MKNIFKKIGITLVIILSLYTSVDIADAAFGYYRAITVDHTKVPNTNQTDFPVGIIGTYVELKATGSGGRVIDAQGDDIGFYTNSDCSTGKMKWERVSWVSTTGAIEYWVKVASLLTASDTTFYMCYGDAGVTTDQSDSANTWNSAYKAVYHLPDGTTLTNNDSTTNALNLTAVNTPTAVAGQIDGGANLGTTGKFTLTNTALDLTSFTYEGWLDVQGDTAGYFFERGPGGSTVNMYLWYQAGTGRWVYGFNNGTSYQDHFYTVALPTGLHYYAYRMDDAGDTIKLFIDGAEVDSEAETTTPSTSGTQVLNIGTDRFSGGHFNGYVDEIRVTNGVRAGDWIATSYNNQSSPSTFYSVGSETALGASTAIKTWIGLVDASVKTWAGLVRASIKSRNGLQ